MPESSILQLSVVVTFVPLVVVRDFAAEGLTVDLQDQRSFDFFFVEMFEQVLVVRREP